MKTMRSPKTSRRLGPSGTGITAGLLVTALLGLAGPLENVSTTSIPTPSSPMTVAWQTEASGGPDSRDDDKDHHDEHDEEHRDDEDRHDERDDDERDEDDSRKKDARDEGRDEKKKAGDNEKKDGSEQDASPRILPTVGQLVSESTGCTGTVIESQSRRLVLTAAQCVYTPQKDNSNLGSKEPGFINEELTFVPGRAGDGSPHGEWVVDGMWVPPQWIETSDTGDPDPRFDVAVLTIAKRDGKTIQDVVGAQGVDFTAGEQSDLTAIGYPAEGRFDGTAQKRCSEPGRVPLKDRLYSMACEMTGGVGGAAWFADLDRNGLGKVVAVSSGLSTDGKRMVGTPLGGAARELIESADTDAANRDQFEEDKNGADKNGDGNGGSGEIEI
jgi:V8-like Glu-specific endopeptidase